MATHVYRVRVVEVGVFYVYITFAQDSQRKSDWFPVARTDDWPRAIVDTAATFLEDLAFLYGAP